MKLRSLLFVTGLVIMSIPTVVFANGNGDVTIQMCGNNPSVENVEIVIGRWDTFDIWIKNDAPLYGISLAFSIDFGDVPFYFDSPYGQFPPEQPVVSFQGVGVYGAFDPAGLQVEAELLPGIVYIHGSATSHPLPVHNQLTLCYTLRLHPTCYGAHSDTLRIDNVIVEPGGTWMFDDGAQYAPTFCGQPNSAVTLPDAPARKWYGTTVGCGYPTFTAAPDTVVTASRGSAFEFTFHAEDLWQCSDWPIEYISDVGTMDLATGRFTLSPGAGCAPVTVTATATNWSCLTDQYTFTVNWVDTPPVFTNCPVVDAYIDTGQVYEYPFRAYDSDACDKVTYSVGNFGGGPHGAFAIDSTGNLVFTPTVDDLGYLYVFDVVANSGCSAIDSCRALVLVGWNTCGDANGDMVLDISDVVSLIAYIFQGGLPPNPPSNGDVDCSGGVDISDVVYIVTHIFSDGPGPCDGCK
jgi:hypothetical protein